MAYSEGGMIEDGDMSPIYLDKGYIIPRSFADAWVKDLLKKLNQELDKPDENMLD